MTLTDPFVVSARIAPLATGALDGLRVAVKDNIAVAGLPTGVGNPTWASTHAIPSIDAACVRALRVAGAEVVGKAHTDEFAYSLAGVNEHYGALPNPADPNLTTGGSSSGCASAVGRGLADLGLGTDTAGSIRVPASYCGLYGLRPTWGRIDMSGVVALAPSFDTVGLLTRDLDTLRRAYAASVPTSPSSTELSVLAAVDLVAGAAPRVRQPIAAIVTRLASHTPVRDVRVVDTLAPSSWAESFSIVQAAEMWREHGDWCRQHRPPMGVDVAARVARAEHLRSDEVVAALETLTLTRAELRSLVAGSILLLPSTADTAPVRGQSAEAQRAATLRLTTLASIGGLPALSVPVTEDGQPPVGLCLVGPPDSELALLELAHLIGTL